MQPTYDVLVVGAGHGGTQLAVALRQCKFKGKIGLFGDEPDAPYERPPLSKEYLAREKPFERILIRPESFWVERNVDLNLGQRVVAVDAAAHTVSCADGRTVGYGTLVWATGGKPRRLSCTGNDLPGVHAVRTRSDVDLLAGELPRIRHVVVVGGGYIGLETAAVLTKLDRSVTVLEAQNRVLARVAGEALSRFYEDEHRARGVDVRLGARVECLIESNGVVSGVLLASGERLPADAVIVGIGIDPEVAPLLNAGADGANGVAVDAFCRTSLPDVFAIGDCAAHVNRYADGATIRLESVQNANDQAIVVAKVLTGEAQAYDAVPWFWSNQYDLRLQTVGLSTNHDDAVLRGDPGARTFSLVYMRADRVIALDCVNATRDYVQGRSLVEAGAAISPLDLADTTRTLKELHAASRPR